MATEKEADKARKDSKSASDQFNDVKKKRFVLIPQFTSPSTHNM